MEWKKLSEKQKTGKFAADPQTGEVYELETEAAWDILAATISVVYLIVMLALFVWQLVDVCTGRLALLRGILHDNAGQLNSDIDRIVTYAVIGGGLGGIVNGFRSILSWHAERRAFGWRHLWKYLTLPFLGATLAAIVYTLSRGGIAVIGGNSTAGNDSTVQAFSAFAIGALSGYGSQKVLKWLDGHVNRLFQISPVAEVEVPELKGKTEQEAKDTLKASEFNLGKVAKEATRDAGEINKVIRQSPLAGTKKPKASSVDITTGKLEVAEAEVPELKGKTELEATDILQASQFNVGTVSRQATTNAGEINKVIRQSPLAGTKRPKASSVDITIGKKE